jgi:hypothetical protein
MASRLMNSQKKYNKPSVSDLGSVADLTLALGESDTRHDGYYVTGDPTFYETSAGSY